jgi:predicted TIM-barrel fold metal-dependent hydrolase
VIVDSLTYLGSSLFGHATSAHDVIGRLDEAHVDAAVVCPVKPRGYHLAEANDVVATAARNSDGRLVGFARVDPNLREDAVSELERALSELGLAGLFLHPWEESFRISAPLVDPVIEVAHRHGAPVIVASGYPWVSEALQVGELARRFPDVNFIMTNGGQINISGLGQADAELCLSEHANVFIQTAGVYREDFLENIVETLGANRVLFGSAFPLMDPRLEILRIKWAHVSDEQKAQMLGGNALSLLGLS